ncbi:hypothetical protein BT93_L4793 [Corymbia citriodora subsp. variegata]|uniref:Mitochondrial outer membrane protein n=1 Tax=Corymbia citriodora subsp. variegata TaxID=360336 RepID=A0A8T0CFP3_CORYI|nr:hypothetical protein BT93_L4793 [Corymbia citriodora subsp. variegata]
MPQDGHEESADGRPQSSTSADRGWNSMFAVPDGVKKVFRRFPLVTYPSNQLPSRSPVRDNIHNLYIWTTAEDAKNGIASFNPSCLKWQTYLKFSDVSFRTIPSSNHASPSGALPFLLPAAQSPSTTTAPAPIKSSKIESWARQHSQKEPSTTHAQADIYTSLLDNEIRRAWLYMLYVLPENFSAIVQPLYVLPSSSNTFVQFALARQLRSAAQDELLKGATHFSEEDTISQARDALAALSTLLGEDEWFFGEKEPGLFDASVFAYTHLLLDEELGWKENKLEESLREHGNLVAHRERIREAYYQT